MPPRYGLRIDYQQDLGPAAPELAQKHPEEAVEPPQARSQVFVFKHSQLLMQDGQLKSKLIKPWISQPRGLSRLS